MKDIARRVVAAKLVGDEIKNIERAAKAELLEEMKALGVRTLDVEGDDGEKLAAVSRAKGRTTAKVNESALLAWVKANRPDQIREVVAPAYIETLKKLAIEHGAAVDATTGEVIPGIEVETADPSVTTRPTAEARALMRDLLKGSPLLELAGGTDA
ncbi:hypothetical protein [Glycomyces paridis]|uniref:Uncharacterized protein n=1 Tax=Glycomyces paridis TaxID=2126555 RepID=A0A4S8P6S7_9ACTN|nr:hypothetical protein [Glycomyces paridis]THV25977.1 hypothetical protein E9998_19785 [Glycomyces paridis]